MNPGATTRPSASIVRVAGPDNLPISAILPSLTPTSPRKAGIPEPSTTRPFLINRSYAIGFLLEGRAAAVRPDPRHCSTRFPRDVRFRRMDRGRAMQKRAVGRQGSVHRKGPFMIVEDARLGAERSGMCGVFYSVSC